MQPDMASDDGDDQHRIEEIYDELTALSIELADIKARRQAREAQNPQEGPKRRFTIIPGGKAALIGIIASLAALLRRRPRHPVALVGALGALGAAALVLTVPAHRTQPPTTTALPPTASLSGSLTALQSNVAPPATASTSTAASGVPASMYIPSARPTPTTSGTAPAGTGSSPTPALDSAPSSPTPSGSCIVEAVVPRVLHLCVA